MTKIIKIISGGQTGVDRAALDVALEFGLPIGGWCPKGRRAEDGRISEKYPLKETDSDDYAVRTEWNVRDSDGTLVITRGKPKGGTAFTLGMTRVHKKPYLVIDLCHCEEPLILSLSKDERRRGNPPNTIAQIHSWLQFYHIRILNIAGPRESNIPGIYTDAKQLLSLLLESLCKSHCF